MYAIVIGDSRVARAIAEQLLDGGAAVGIVASRDAQELAMAFPSALVIRGEGGDTRALEAAGAREADLVVAACDEDAANLAACVEARSVFGVARVVALSRCTDNAAAFRALDVPVVCATTLIANALLEDAGVVAEQVAR